jgi:hypothetical protein
MQVHHNHTVNFYRFVHLSRTVFNTWDGANTIPHIFSSAQNHTTFYETNASQLTASVVRAPGPLRLVSSSEELFRRKSSGSVLENRDYGRREPPRWPRDTHLSAKVGTNFANKQRSLSIVRSRTKAIIIIFYFGVLHPIVRILSRLLMHPNYYEVAHDYTSFAFFFLSTDIVTVGTLWQKITVKQIT